MGQLATIPRPGEPAIRTIHARSGDEQSPARDDAPIRFSSGADLYREGDCAGAVYVLLSGRVRLTNRATQAPAMMTGLLRPGALFGVDSLSEDVFAETASAETDCMVRVVPVPLIDLLLKRQPGFAAGLMEALVRRRTDAEGLLTRALLTGVPGRLAGALLDAAEGGTVAGRTRRQLAEAAWTTRETATRMLFHFVEDGLVRVTGRSIELLNFHQLRLLAGGVRRGAAA